MSGDQLDLDAIVARATSERLGVDDASRLIALDVPALVAEVRRLRAKVERVEALHNGTHWCFKDGADDVYERGTEWWPCPSLAAVTEP